jgi:hypothetical protein
VSGICKYFSISLIPLYSVGMVALVLLLRREGNFKLPLRQRNSFLLNSNTIPPSSPVYHRARSFRLIVFVFNISFLPFFSCLRRLGLRITLFPFPDLLFDGIFELPVFPRVALSRLVVEHCSSTRSFLQRWSYMGPSQCA